MARKYSGENTLSYFMQIVKAALAGKVSKTDIVNNVTSNDTDKPLSAAQGKALAESIAAAGGGDMTKAVYDTNNDGVVDNAEKLNGKADTAFVLDADFNTKAATYVTSQKGQANGVCGLDANGKIPTSLLPTEAYAEYDDFKDGYLDTTTGKFYKDAEKTQEIAGASDTLYVDKITNKFYRWSGTQFTEIPTGDDMTEISNQEVQTLWDNTMV